MPKTIVYSDPDNAAGVGVGLDIRRVAPGNAGVILTYYPNNGDASFETTAAALTAGARTNLLALQGELLALMKASRGYT